MKRTTLSGCWELEMNGHKSSVTVPHDFMIGTERRADSSTGADQGYFTPGRAVYRRTFTADDTAERHILCFDGVMGLTEVYLNGQLLRFHPYGYTAFLCDCGRYLRQGENRLDVIADTTVQPCSRWYTGGGIIRDAELLTAGRDCIEPWGITVRTLSLCGSDAYAEFAVSILSSADQEAKLNVTVSDDDGVTAEFTRHIWLNDGENTVSFKKMLHGITPWDTDHPKLYRVTVTLTAKDSEDSDTILTGFRTVECDGERGFLLNGRPVQMNGMCVHHDNGVLGAVSTHDAEERRVRIMKRDGFNALRTSHNPPSTALLDMCDRYGILVIDEIFDAWRIGKKNMDYHIWFDKYHEEDTRSMVIRDRNHPSVVMWSTGNEIPEKNGVSDGYKTAKKLADLIRSLDDRPLTHALCDFWDNWEYRQLQDADNHKPATELDFYAAKTAITADMLDVAGYNYHGWRLEKDRIRFPDRLIALTESFPMDAAWVKKMMDTDPRLIGEFVWTGWDYFGETGLGRVEYGKEGTIWGLSGYPEHHANCGDYDICGFKKPQWYYRHAAYNKGEVYILTADPAKFGEKYAISAWGLYDCARTWTHPGMEGRKTTVYLFSVADEVELWQDGISLGRFTPNEKGVVTCETEYRPGHLTTAAYVNGVETFRDTIETSGQPALIEMETECFGSTIFCAISVHDEKGNLCTGFEEEITVSAVNAAVIGTASGRMDDDHIYTAPSCRAYGGRILAVLRGLSGSVEITAETKKFTASVKEDV